MESVSASVLIRVAAANVTAPVRVLLPETLSRAPLVVVVPVPLRVSESPTVIPPWTWRVAPEATVVPAAVVPSAVAL